jgi:flagellar biogenesis protein FliO
MPTLLLFLRMVVALAIVLGLVLVASRLLQRGRGALGSARRPSSAFAGLVGPSRRSRAGSSLFSGFGLNPRPQDAFLEVVGRRPLGRTSSLVLARAGDRFLLLGTTAQSVELLAELSAADLGLDPAGGEPSHDARVTAVERLPLRAAPRPARAGDHLDGTPWTAMPDAGSTTAWDAFLASLRERTVRR